MAQQKIDDTELITKIADVFRRLGYDGTSMTELTKATGLQRASLYHRFPNGKQEMAAAVIEKVGADLKSVLSGLNADTDLSATDKLAVLKKKLTEFYQQGAVPCLIDSMSYNMQTSAHGSVLKQSVAALIEELAKMAQNLGKKKVEARTWAIQLLTTVQGALVVSRALEEPAIFKKAIADLGSNSGRA